MCPSSSFVNRVDRVGRISGIATNLELCLHVQLGLADSGHRRSADIGLSFHPRRAPALVAARSRNSLQLRWLPFSLVL